MEKVAVLGPGKVGALAAELLLGTGFLKQEDISLEAFLKTKNGTCYAGN
ncbi:hypothetical protein DFR48_106103 [Ciceribacter lividus]|uniref:Uncharacterized protein n=1 Tax=Ciceribacter lividus TaxID=1197950 RepID=A0A6I7HMI2_9HYPH|nr:hypothetical protein [Ciceribacter lividus]RCW23981.1 hypothetical protein DFR48_106103 [Ciceribacter lividus]